MDIKEYFANKNRNDYQRDNFDSFLKKVSFTYNVPSIHIAGTNGKGSTATYLAKIYEKQGYKVGLYISPWLINVNEMISINSQNISSEDFEKYILKDEKLFNKYGLSCFEIQTYIALSYFKDQKCDVAVIECGMGGEVDATNIFKNILSIITSVSLEHTSFLGRTISEIAANKAGIIKEESPVLIGDLSDEAKESISITAKEMKSKIYSYVEPSNIEFINEGYKFDYLSYSNLQTNSLAKYSVYNAALALYAADILKEQFPISIENIRAALKDVRMSCRLMPIMENPLVILDGGHNPEGVQKLCESLENVRKNRNIHVIFACFKDKNLERMLASLGEVSDDICLTTFDHERARGEFEYFLFLEEYKFYPNALDIINQKIKDNPDDIILITGSLAFVGYVYSLYLKGEITYEKTVSE